jgi:hypothetical protein
MVLLARATSCRFITAVVCFRMRAHPSINLSLLPINCIVYQLSYFQELSVRKLFDDNFQLRLLDQRRQLLHVV